MSLLAKVKLLGGLSREWVLWPARRVGQKEGLELLQTGTVAPIHTRLCLRLGDGSRCSGVFGVRLHASGKHRRDGKRVEGGRRARCSR